MLSTEFKELFGRLEVFLRLLVFPGISEPLTKLLADASGTKMIGVPFLSLMTDFAEVPKGIQKVYQNGFDKK